MKEEGVLEFLAEAGIETPEEAEDVTNVIDKTTGEVGPNRHANHISWRWTAVKLWLIHAQSWRERRLGGLGGIGRCQ